MMQRQFNPNQPVPPYGPNVGMTPPGPPNMSHLSRNRMSPTPNRMRDFSMSPNKQVCSAVLVSGVEVAGLGRVGR